jgi:uncharacterized phage-associated protein
MLAAAKSQAVTNCVMRQYARMRALALILLRFLPRRHESGNDSALVNRYSPIHIPNREERNVNPIRYHGRRDNGRMVVQMTYTPQHIANYFLDKGDLDCIEISQMKLHKLVFIAYGWHLALKGETLFDEKIEAWEHGPVVRSLYPEFKNFGKDPITVRSVNPLPDWLEDYVPRVDETDYDTRLILDRVWESFKGFTAWALRNKTHEPDTPWAKAYIEGQKNPIDDVEIAAYYRERIGRYLEAA